MKMQITKIVIFISLISAITFPKLSEKNKKRIECCKSRLINATKTTKKLSSEYAKKIYDFSSTHGNVVYEAIKKKASCLYNKAYTGIQDKFNRNKDEGENKQILEKEENGEKNEVDNDDEKQAGSDEKDLFGDMTDFSLEKFFKLLEDLKQKENLNNEQKNDNEADEMNSDQDEEKDIEDMVNDEQVEEMGEEAPEMVEDEKVEL